jgi:glutamine amidotransferase
MLGYVGQELPLGRLIDDPPHSLTRQSYAARELATATVCADGWGFGFYLGAESGDNQAPCLYRSVLPIWADVNRSHLGRAVRARVVMAAVRSATDPLSLSHANTQPFAAGNLLFAHNGFIQDFAVGMQRRMEQLLSDARYAELIGSTDSERIFALIRDRYESSPCQPGSERLVGAVCSAVDTLRRLSTELGKVALFSLIVSDGVGMVAMRTAVGRAEPPSLYVRPAPESSGGAVVASEPLDAEPGWLSIAADHALVIGSDGALLDVALP